MDLSHLLTMTFDFEKGITAVIGPNGCGKSNVVDSIKWVVGEQSAKALRGGAMTDVISGCATRRLMALAEVTLVLEMEGMHGGEVAITRRLTSDGVSSYDLNGKPSRLKDFRELFMGTGVGNSAYSVIEQGRIGFILEASVKDRRGIIEEAAGVSRHKARRKVAMRKLEHVEVDLERSAKSTPRQSSVCDKYGVRPKTPHTKAANACVIYAWCLPWKSTRDSLVNRVSTKKW